jgi:MFS family permease
MLGGALFGVSRFLPFATDALSYVASLSTLLMIKAPMQEADTADLTKNLVRGLAEGLRWTWNQPFLRLSALAAAVVNLCLQAQSLAVIVLARDDGASPAVTGVIVACTGLGGLLGSFASPWLVQRVRPGMIITGCLWGCALCTGLLAAVPGALWLCPVMAVLGLMMSPWNVASQSYRMRITPNRMLARVSSVAFQVAWGVMPLGSLLAGGLLAAISPANVMAIVALLLGLTAIIATASRPMRSAGSASDPSLIA